MNNHLSATVIAQALGSIDQGDTENLDKLLGKYPALCASRNTDDPPPTPESALLLHLTNWPGGKPNGAATARLLIGAGADPMLRFEGSGETVLHWAVSNDKDAAIVETLLDAGADIDALGGVICGGTPLMNALYFGFTDIAALLVDRGASVHNLILAAGLGRMDLIESWHQGDGQYLCDAIRVCPQAESAGTELLDLKSTQTWTYRAVICALVCEQYHIVNRLIEYGFDVNLTPDDIGWSCLHHAAYWGSLPMAMYLVCQGAELDVREEHNATPADYGGVHGHPDVMNFLIDMGTPTSVQKAATVGRLDLIIAGLETCDDKASLLMGTVGNTTAVGKPIHADIMRGRAAVARYLIQTDADIAHQLVDGKSAWALAEELDDQYWLSAVGPMPKQ